MKKISIYMTLLGALFMMSSCTEWLKEPGPNETSIEEYFESEASAINNINADYTPLGWEWNHVFYNEFVFGDIMSDDALKGGNGITDCADFYYLENFKYTADNQVLLEYYRANYIGIARCNVSLANIPKMKPEWFSEGMQDRLIGEAKFLRAYYYFRLWRVFHDVPLVLEPVEKVENWKASPVPAGQIMEQILTDLTDAEALLWDKDDSRFHADVDLGRVTKGAAQALLLKVNLYNHNYAEAETWGRKIVEGGKYDLATDYASNFTLAGENNIESVFEIQYMSDGTSDWGDGNGFTRGSYAQVMTRSRSNIYWNQRGYGFNKPTQNLYDEFETGDPRREATFWVPPTNLELAVEEIYLGNKYCSRKTALIESETPEAGKYVLIGHDTRGPLNRKDIRFADVLLMYAEACAQTGNTGAAESALERVRSRARNLSSNSEALPSFPNYQISVLGTVKTPSLLEAIQHERRVELAMEGHRWYDLIRWGNAKEVMDYYATTETPEAQSHMAPFIKGQHEYFPMPTKELDLIKQ